MSLTALQVRAKTCEDSIADIGQIIDSGQIRQPSKPAIGRHHLPHGNGRINSRVHLVSYLDMQDLPGPAEVHAMQGRVKFGCRDIDK